MLEQFNQAIDTASNVNLKDGSSWWFDRETQRKYIFNIAAHLVSNHDITPKEALETAEQLVQEFYINHIQPSTRKP